MRTECRLNNLSSSFVKRLDKSALFECHPWRTPSSQPGLGMWIEGDPLVGGVIRKWYGEERSRTFSDEELRAVPSWSITIQKSEAENEVFRLTCAAWELLEQVERKRLDTEICEGLISDLYRASEAGVEYLDTCQSLHERRSARLSIILCFTVSIIGIPLLILVTPILVSGLVLDFIRGREVHARALAVCDEIDTQLSFVGSAIGRADEAREARNARQNAEWSRRSLMARDGLYNTDADTDTETENLDLEYVSKTLVWERARASLILGGGAYNTASDTENMAWEYVSEASVRKSVRKRVSLIVGDGSYNLDSDAERESPIVGDSMHNRDSSRECMCRVFEPILWEESVEEFLEVTTETRAFWESSSPMVTMRAPFSQGGFRGDCVRTNPFQAYGNEGLESISEESDVSEESEAQQLLGGTIEVRAICEIPPRKLVEEGGVMPFDHSPCKYSGKGAAGFFSGEEGRQSNVSSPARTRERLQQAEARQAIAMSL